MKVIKKLFAIVLACTFVMVGINYGNILTPVTTVAETDFSNQLEQDKQSPIIYRTTGNLAIKGGGRATLGYTLTARENGNINISISPGTNFYSSSLKNSVLGSLKFNSNMIAPIGISGANGVSILNDHTYFETSELVLVRSYNEEEILYSLTYIDNRNTLSAIFNLYVKEPYLTTNQTINLSDNEIEIPFGDSNPPADKDTYIQELENKVTELENKITELESNPITPYKPGDINGDGIIDATDASSILCYYAYVMTGGDGNLNILDFVENEDEYMAANVTSTTTTVPITTTTTTQTTTTTTTTPSMDIGGSESNYESEFSSNNTGGIRNQFDKKPMG